MGEISTIYAQIFCLATLNIKKKYYSTIFYFPEKFSSKTVPENARKKMSHSAK